MHNCINGIRGYFITDNILIKYSLYNKCHVNGKQITTVDESNHFLINFIFQTFS